MAPDEHHGQGEIHAREEEQDLRALRRLAASATTHCLTGCAIGEVLGVVIGTALGWGNAETIALAVVLAFLFGYSFTLYPLLRAGVAGIAALGIAFAADTLSITVMEIVDNAIILLVPGAMEAGLGSLLFWGSLAVALAIAWVFAFPVNYYLLKRGKGHALVHAYHGKGHEGH
ncbi:MAG: DUF4396 domain-containing protein [Actinobacteria bacterium]|nr:DUF4396 domain-containing protein [Actinomycetota bacterium]